MAKHTVLPLWCNADIKVRCDDDIRLDSLVIYQEKTARKQLIRLTLEGNGKTVRMELYTEFAA